MKRFLLILLTISIFIIGCARRPRIAYPPARLLEKPLVKVESTRKDIVLSCRWKRGDTEPKTFCLITPPKAMLQPALVDYTLIGHNTDDNTLPLTRGDAEKKYGAQFSDELLHCIAITPEGFLRFNYLQSVKINPVLTRSPLGRVQTLPHLGKKHSYALSSIKLRIEFKNPSVSHPVKSKKTSQLDYGFGRILSALVENPQMASAYATTAPPPNFPEMDFSHKIIPPPEGAGGIPTLQLFIKNPGIYKIDQALIMKGGIKPDAVDPKYFHLFCEGHELPLATWGCFAKHFTPNDALLFYGFPTDCRYTDTNVFQLYYDPTRRGLRMNTIGDEKSAGAERPEFSIAPKSLEEDKQLKIHAGNFLSIKGMRWVWRELTSSEVFRHTFDLPGYVSIPGEGKAIIRLYCHPGEFTPGTRIVAQINDATSHTFTLRNINDDEKDFKLDFRALREEGNLFTLRVLPPIRPGEKTNSGTSGVYFDHLTVHYARRFAFHRGTLTFETEAPEAGVLRTYKLEGAPPRPIIGVEYSDVKKPCLVRTKKTSPGRMEFTTTESDSCSYLFNIIDLIPTPIKVRPVKFAKLSDGKNAAQYLVIAYADFIPVVKPLCAFRQKQGLKTKIVDVESIYDEFNYGILSPVAIKQFLATALLHWQTRPTYVLLVGDSTSDYKNQARNNVANYVPAYSHITKNAQQDKWASDHWYTTLLGKDEYPDINLGRLSVNSPRDAKSVVNKILHYEKKPLFSPWRTTLGYIADDGPFDEEAEDLRQNYTPPTYAGKTVYLENLPFEDNFYLDKAFVEKTMAKVSTIATAKILELFQSGAVALSFYGHGSPNIWADERIWFGGDSQNSDNLHLTNIDCLPFVINMTCNSGAIDYPVPKWNVCISEDCMRQPKGGAIALFVPSGPGFTSSHRKISIALRDALFKKRIHRLGDAVTLARCLYLGKKYPKEIIQMFILLGDPALNLQLPAEEVSLRIDRKVVHSSLITPHLPATVKVSGTIASFRRGNVIFRLYSPANEIVGETGEEKFSGGAINQVFKIPQGAENGKWIVRVYASNIRYKLDAAGAATFLVGEPFLRLTKPRVRQSLASIRTHKPLKLLVDVKNDSAVACPDARVELINLSDSTKQPFSLSLPLAPGEIKTFSYDVVPKQGLNVYKFHIPQYSENPDPEIPIQANDLLSFVASDDALTTPDLAISADLLKRSYIQGGHNYRMTLQFPLYNLGRKPLKYAEVVLRAGAFGNGKIVKSTRINSVNPTMPRNVSLDIPIVNPLARRTFTIEARPPAGANDPTPTNNRFTFTYDPTSLPDLKIDAKTIKVSEKSPTEGKTVFFDVPVMNQGGSPATNVKICLYDNDPEKGGKTLFNYSGSPLLNIPHLRAGATKIIRLRWDPVKNSGSKDAFIKVDTLNRIPERDEENNLAVIHLYIRTKAQLKPAGIEICQTPQERKKLIVHLIARVENKGETEAKNVSVAFFRGKIQSRKTFLGETLIPRINPGETAETDFIWKVTEREARFTYRPTFQVFLKGSTQRLSSVEGVEKSEKNAPQPVEKK